MKRDLEDFFVPDDFDKALPMEIRANNPDEQETANSVIVMASFYFKLTLTDIANSILREYVKENGKVVYGPTYCNTYDATGPAWERWETKNEETALNTHTAILLDEKEIKGDA